MKKITDSFIFQQALKNEKTKTAIQGVLPSKFAVSDAAIDEQIRVITKRMKYAGKDLTMELYSKGILIPFYNPNLKIPKYINSFMKQEGGKIVTVCDLTNFARISKDDLADISAKVLFTLMQSSAIYYELYNNWNKYTTNASILKMSANIYAKMIGKVLDKLYAIKIDPFKTDLIHFLLAKFFIVNLCDRIPTNTVDQMAKYAMPNGNSLDLIQAEAAQLSEDDFKSFDSFIKGLSTLNMKNLNVRIVVENFARMYGETTLLALDYLPSFYGVIFGVAVQGGLCKDYILEGLCGKQIESLYIDFFKLS